MTDAAGTNGYFIGLMSGTSMDGVDGVLATFSAQAQSGETESASTSVHVLAHASLPMPTSLQRELLALNSPGDNELHRAAVSAHALVRLYAQVCQRLLAQSGIEATDIKAIGAHGQTVRHQPGAVDACDATGYTLQLNNPALLAELTGISVVADFRSRDVAAGGQGAPLVPAFHQQIFARADVDIAVLNLGGISNLTLLPAGCAGAGGPAVRGFDCGPANVLMDHWIAAQRQLPYDADGAWAGSGHVHAGLLASLLQEPFFSQAPPKSTGRDLFHGEWLQRHLQASEPLPAEDVQATLLELTVQTVLQDLLRHQAQTQQLLVCGGGALNRRLMQRLAAALIEKRAPTQVVSSAELGLPPLQVEAAAFAWLAQQAMAGRPANLPVATGAVGPRILGAIYPA